jgi:hypothetical protein
MNDVAKSKVQLFGAWCADGYLVLLYVGWGAVAGFLPPTRPDAGTQTIAHLYATDHTQIRIGMLIVMLAALVFIPFAAAMAQYITHVEGRPGVLTYSFLLGAAGNMCLTFYPAVWWLIAAFRPDRPAALTQLVNDAAWLQFLGGVTIYLAMPLVVGIAALADESEHPVLPRWVGWTNLWMALAIIPDQLLFFFKSGPFAWSGLFGIWLPIVWFSGFFLVNFVALRGTILADRAAGLTPRLAT